jgi:acetyl-CoA carboxylase biotin carboxyl carrier protein
LNKNKEVIALLGGLVKIKRIRKIIRAFEQSSLVQLEITVGKLTIKMQKPSSPASFSDSQNLSAEQIAPVENYWIYSPLVGTFYMRITSESQPFITLGQHVKQNETLCIIETMKVFNEIKSPVDGIITKITAEDGEMVEYNQAIIEIKCND